jgi:hypothetical protein
LQCTQIVQVDSDDEQNAIDPLWGNNWEASSSVTPQVPRRLVRMDSVSRNEANLDLMQIEPNNPALDQVDIVISNQIVSEANDGPQTEVNDGLQLALLPEDDIPQPI